ncbi:hypothetical protein BH11VER1_BH11VER1_29970 [soil metagenome]
MDTPAPDIIPAVPPKKSRWRQNLLAISIAVLMLLCVAGWMAVPKIRGQINDRQASQLIDQAEANLKAGEFDLAYRQLAQAYQKSASEPRVIRLIADCYDQVPGSEEHAVFFRRQLIDKGVATWNDRVALCQAHLRQSDFVAAQEAFTTIPAEVRQETKVRELQASILSLTGHQAEALQILRDTWGAKPEDVQSRVKLAGLDVNSLLIDIRKAALSQLWESARSGGEESSFAMRALIRSDKFNAGNAEELVNLLGKNKSISDRDGYTILDSCLAVAPSLLPEAITVARARVSEDQPGARDYLYQWFSQHNQTDLILKEVTQKEALLSRNLLLAYIDALMRTGQLNDIDHLLTQPKLPLSALDVDLLRATCSRARSESDETLRLHLRNALMRASLANDYQGLAQVAGGAESFNQLDIAVEACLKLATKRSLRLEMLKRVFNLQQQRRNSLGMLDAALEVLGERPGLVPYADTAAYLKFLTGMNMESAMSDGAPLQGSPLTQALAAYYSGDLETMRQQLDQVQASSLKSGPRAVLAGLLRVAGQTREGVAIAESISSALLLPEEEWFLNLSLH